MHSNRIAICFGIIQWPTWVLFGAAWMISAAGITAGYHRLFSHVTYKAVWPVRLVLMLLGSSVFQGSILEWSTDHRKHHLYTETEKDPYNIKQGFWYAHIGWLFVLDPNKRDFSNVEDLMQDPIVRFQHRFYIPIAIFMGYIVPALIASLWGDPLGGLLIGGALRIAVAQQSTFCINSICHYFGKKTYSEEQEARDNWVTALITMGEGYHNFHHQFPKDYRNAVRFYQFDPSKWLIRLLSYLGLASDLRRVNPEIIAKYKVRHDWLAVKSQPYYEQIQDLVKPAYEHLQALLKKMEYLQSMIKNLKKQNYSSKVEEYKILLKGYKKELRCMKRQLRCSLKAWNPLVLGLKRQPLF